MLPCSWLGTGCLLVGDMSVDRIGKFFWRLMTLGQVISVSNFC